MLLHHCVAELQNRIKEGSYPRLRYFGSRGISGSVVAVDMRSFRGCRASSWLTLAGWA